VLPTPTLDLWPRERSDGVTNRFRSSVNRLLARRVVIPSGASAEHERSRGIVVIPVVGPLYRDDSDSSTPPLRGSARNDGVTRYAFRSVHPANDGLLSSSDGISKLTADPY
jgi:hypothetical protein